MKPFETALIVSHDLQMQVVLDDGTRSALPVNLTHHTGDPHAVSATFRSAESITWTFARELLRDGLNGVAGSGDVVVRPSHPSRAKVTITLRSEHGAALIEADRADVAAFVAQMYRNVPDGSEWMYLDIDRAIESIFAGDL